MKNWKVATTGLCIIGDAILIFLSIYLAYHLRFFSPLVVSRIPPIKGIPPWEGYYQAAFVIIPIWILVFAYEKIYKFTPIFFFDDFLNIVKAISVSAFLTLGLSFFYRGFEFSRLVIGMAYIICICFIFTWHRVIRFLNSLIGRKFPIKNTLIVGKPDDSKRLRHRLRHHAHTRVSFLREFDFEKIKYYISSKNVDEVIAVEGGISNEMLLKLADICNARNVVFKVLPEMFQLRRGEISIDSNLGLPVYQLRSIALCGMNFLAKRIFDVVLSTLMISLLSPLLLLISWLIKVDSKGPVIYAHKRKGLNGKNFTFLKFRTMIKDADNFLEQLKSKSERGEHVFKMKRDPRVTRVGYILRRFSLDELPQLFNVLRGDMSLVGPRPQVLWETEYYTEYEKRRLNVLPGITGLWQVLGRADVSFEEMVKLDIYYIENWSLGLDINILLKTIPAVLSAKGAY